jgi:molecular chaperone DnaJ
MDDRDPRAVLGLPLDATKGEAQRAFRALAKQTHPDAGGDPAAFRAVAGAWADLASVLPADAPTGSRPAPAPSWRALSPHARAYRPVPSRVVWAELRPPVRPVDARRAHRSGPDFATVLKAEMARQAA